MPLAEQKRGNSPSAWGNVSGGSSLLSDVPIALGTLAFFYGFLSLAHYWAAPLNPETRINLTVRALPVYALFSIARLATAYVLSLAVSVMYGYIAAHNSTAERFMVPLLDTLQSIPVLCFLPGVMISMAALFPTTQFGLELGSILLIFTGMVWNMAFSIYASLKSIPSEMLEAARLYRLSWWQKLIQVELPHTTIGLIWNSMMSVAGGWFALMACEMFVLGNRDLRLPGLGSYLQSASNEGNVRSIVLGLLGMVTVIVTMDRVIWRPMIAWSEKFKFEQVEASQVPTSRVLDFLRRSKLLSQIYETSIAPAREAVTLHFARIHTVRRTNRCMQVLTRWASRVAGACVLAGILFAIGKMAGMLTAISRTEIKEMLWGTAATFLRVELTLFLAALWTIPVGVFIGLRPKLASTVQPMAQIAASIPAPALFPIILLLLIQIGGGLGVASIVLLLLGTQWYILFNVIAGAMAIPADLKEVCHVYHFRSFQRWRKLLLPAIFPYLITGLVTASGGAWNASIIAEYFRFRGQTFSITGLGAVISRATDAGNFPVLLGATVIISAMVVTINRLLWRRLYSVASTKFRLELT